MWNLLQKIRAKPVNVRKKILFISATSLTLIIFLVWASAFISGISQTTSAENERKEAGVFSFVNVFQNAFADILATTKKEIGSSSAAFIDFDSKKVYTRQQ